MGIFDESARYATEAEPEAVLTRLLRGRDVALRFREWVETRTTPRRGETERTADKVAALADPSAPDRPWLMVLEFQAQHDPDKLDVTLQTAGQLRTGTRHGEDRRGKYNVIVAMVYLRGRCPEAVLDTTLPGGFGTRHAPLVWNLEEDSASEALDALAAGQTTWGILFWIALMQGGGDPAIIERWKEMAAALPEARTRADLAEVALVFAALADRFLAWEKALEDWDVTESQITGRWIERGELRKARIWLLQTLRERFPEGVPQDVAETINSQPSVTLLDEWFSAALKCASLQEFIAFLRR
jgi:hypothetical protein